MTTEHDEALVERVARAFYTERGFTSGSFDTLPNKGHWVEAARAVIYPPAPPKTRLQVARELLAQERGLAGCNASRILEGLADESSDMRAVLAALALPAMED